MAEGFKERMTAQDPTFGGMPGALPGMTLVDRAGQAGQFGLEQLQWLLKLLSGVGQQQPNIEAINRQIMESTGGRGQVLRPDGKYGPPPAPLPPSQEY